MRPDQLASLREIEERLADAFIDEADPKAWPNYGTPSADLDKEERAQRYQYKRAACETAQLLTRTQAIITGPRAGDPDDPYSSKEASNLINDAERRASKAVHEALERAKGARAK